MSLAIECDFRFIPVDIWPVLRICFCSLTKEKILLHMCNIEMYKAGIFASCHPVKVNMIDGLINDCSHCRSGNNFDFLTENVFKPSGLQQ